MARPRPALTTLALSGAAVLGYLTYRVIADGWLEPVPMPPAAPVETAGASDAAQAPQLVDKLPEFTLEGLNHEPVASTSWPGKPLIFNFWATWCAPCKREIPMLKEFQTAHPELQVVGIAIDRHELVVEYAAEAKFNYAIMIGDYDAATVFGLTVNALPFTVFTAADGSMLGAHSGEMHAEHLDNLAAVLRDLEAGTVDLATARRRLSGHM